MKGIKRVSRRRGREIVWKKRGREDEKNSKRNTRRTGRTL